MTMPRGVPKNGLWRGLEPLDEWIRRMQASAPLCECGCGEHIQIQRHHRNYGVPAFVHGHHTRVSHGSYKGVDRWVREHDGKHRCACGCGGTIAITARHHAIGIPRYLPAHHAPPNLGHGPDHPSYIKDRSLVKARNGQGFTPWVMRQICEQDRRRCVRCGVGERLEYDHIVPIAEGGTGDAANGQLLCHKCHRLKTNADLARRRLQMHIHRLIQTVGHVLDALDAYLSSNTWKEVVHGCHW